MALYEDEGETKEAALPLITLPETSALNACPNNCFPSAPTGRCNAVIDNPPSPRCYWTSCLDTVCCAQQSSPGPQ